MKKPQRVIIGLSAGIAAYKIPFLIRLFRKADVEVKVVLTKNSMEFVTPLTLETLSENKVYIDMFENAEQYTTGHISITDWADCMIVAPATANTIAKFAAGIADDALSTTFLSFNRQVFVAPAMNTKMLENKATQNNIQILRNRGVKIVEPAHGFLACGYDGKGRMEEAEGIFNFVMNHYSEKKVLCGKKVLVTAGPTYEPIDPVRFIGNHSSGKMGLSIAESFADLGAEVVVVKGPTSNIPTRDNIKVVNVYTAAEMYESCMQHSDTADIVVMAAAVADYTPVKVATEKIKKHDDEFLIKLTKTKDILFELGKNKKPNQFIVGFALETNNEFENAKNKLKNKKVDAIVLNSLRDEGSGFGYDTNKISIIDNNEITDFELKTKSEVAKDIVNYVLKALKIS